MTDATENFVVTTKVKAALKEGGLNVAGDAIEGLNTVIYFYIDQAKKRAQANGRKTVKAHDFLAS